VTRRKGKTGLLRRVLRRIPPLDRAARRLRCAWGVEPLVESWGERGKSIHRHYLEEFLRSQASSIRGRCLEFQEDSYTTRFGGDRVSSIDILNKEPGRKETTLVADLTAENDLPSDYFDCVICTYVLHIIYEKERVISELHRVLKPGGTLLVCVPNITVHYPRFPELWRFTADGLGALLARRFGQENVSVTGYGNSLTAVGELRGLGVDAFSSAELSHHDPRYALAVCGRARKQ
jgi:hypothetical protein